MSSWWKVYSVLVVLATKLRFAAEGSMICSTETAGDETTKPAITKCSCVYSYSEWGCLAETPSSFTSTYSCGADFCRTKETIILGGKWIADDTYSLCTDHGGPLTTTVYPPGFLHQGAYDITYTTIYQYINATKTIAQTSYILATTDDSRWWFCPAGWTQDLGKGSCMYNYYETRCDRSTRLSKIIDCPTTDSCLYQEILQAPGTKYHQAYMRQCQADGDVQKTVYEVPGNTGAAYSSIIFQEGWVTPHTVTKLVHTDVIKPCPEQMHWSICSAYESTFVSAFNVRSLYYAMGMDYCEKDWYGSMCSYSMKLQGPSVVVEKSDVDYCRYMTTLTDLPATATSQMTTLPYYLIDGPSDYTDSKHTFQQQHYKAGILVAKQEVHMVASTTEPVSPSSEEVSETELFTSDSLATSSGFETVSYSHVTHVSSYSVPIGEASGGTGRANGDYDPGKGIYVLILCVVVSVALVVLAVIVVVVCKARHYQQEVVVVTNGARRYRADTIIKYSTVDRYVMEDEV